MKNKFNIIFSLTFLLLISIAGADNSVKLKLNPDEGLKNIKVENRPAGSWIVIRASGTNEVEIRVEGGGVNQECVVNVTKKNRNTGVETSISRAIQAQKVTATEPVIPLIAAKDNRLKLESILRQALDILDRNDLVTLNKFATERGLDLKGDNLLVTVELKINISGKDRILSQVMGLGGKALNVSNKHVSISIPLSKLDKLIADKDILFVHTIERGDYDEVISQGLVTIKANQWHKSGLKGKGVKIAIVDTDFKNYQQSIANGDLPANIITKTFGPANVDEGESAHGTGCGEIVYDIAPEAQLYLISTFSDDPAGFKNLADYLINEKINVVSRSLSEYRGTHNGTSLFAKEINRARDAGIIWVNSAGNRARTHWEGFYNDGGNQDNQFSNNDTMLKISATQVKLRFTWNDWAQNQQGDFSGNAHGQDYDIYVYKNGQLVASSETDQLNNPAADPFEKVAFSSFSINDNCEIKIKAKNSTGFGNYLELFSHSSGDFEYPKPESSLSVGGDADGSITIGAVDYLSKKLEDYSSQGPTNGLNDGPPDINSLIKPDVSGPTNVNTFAYGLLDGTSAATPHIAGAAALVYQAMLENKIAAENPGQPKPKDVKQYLEKYSDLLGYAAPKNNQVGAGLVVLNDPIIINTVPVITPEITNIYNGCMGNYLKQQTSNQMLIIYGSDFDENAEMVIGQGAAEGIVVKEMYFQSDKQISGAIDILGTPALGKRDVMVINPGGKSVTAKDILEIKPKWILSINKINIKQLKQGETKTLYLQGEYFEPKKTKLDFGPGIIIKTLSILDPYNLNATVVVSDEALPGPRDIILSHDLYPAPAVIKGMIEVVGVTPQITQVLPIKFNQGLQNIINVFGKNLKQGYNLSFGENSGIKVVPSQYLPQGYKWYSEEQVQANISVSFEAYPGMRNLTLTNPDGATAVVTNAFEVLPMPDPIITTVMPTAIKQGQEDNITILGENFHPDFKLEFDKPGISIVAHPENNLPTGYQFVNPKNVSAHAHVDNNAKIGTMSFEFINPNNVGVTATIEVIPLNAITSPEIKQVSPDKIYQGQVNVVHIYGKFMQEGCSIDLGPDIIIKPNVAWNNQGIVYMGSYYIIVNAEVNEQAKLGPRQIKLTNPDGGSAIGTLNISIDPSKPYIGTVHSEIFLDSGYYDSFVPRGWTGWIFLGGITNIDQIGKFDLGEGISVLEIDLSKFHPAVQEINSIRLKITVAKDAAIGPRTLYLRKAGSQEMIAKKESAISVYGLKAVVPDKLYKGVTQQSVSIEGEGAGFSKYLIAKISDAYSQLTYVNDNLLQDKLVNVGDNCTLGPKIVYLYPQYPLNSPSLTSFEGLVSVVNAPPVLKAVAPIAAKQGEEFTFTIFGKHTNFNKYTKIYISADWPGNNLPPADWKGDIVGPNNIIIESPDKISAKFIINADAKPSKRNVGVSLKENADGIASVVWLDQAFEVLSKVALPPVPAIQSISPEVMAYPNETIISVVGSNSNFEQGKTVINGLPWMFKYKDLIVQDKTHLKFIVYPSMPTYKTTNGVLTKLQVVTNNETLNLPVIQVIGNK